MLAGGIPGTVMPLARILIHDPPRVDMAVGTSWPKWALRTREAKIDLAVRRVIANNRIKSWFALNEFRLYFRNGTEWSPTGALFIEQVRAEWRRMVA